MKISTILILLFIVLLSSSMIPPLKHSKPKNHWELVWSDEFSGDKLDTGKWNVLVREHSKHNE